MYGRRLHTWTKKQYLLLQLRASDADARQDVEEDSKRYASQLTREPKHMTEDTLAK
jgi:hypothetical protein